MSLTSGHVPTHLLESFPARRDLMKAPKTEASNASKCFIAYPMPFDIHSHRAQKQGKFGLRHLIDGNQVHSRDLSQITVTINDKRDVALCHKGNCCYVHIPILSHLRNELFFLNKRKIKGRSQAKSKI